MTDTFAEYCEVTVTDPLRQGDVLEAVGARASCWQRHLMVITADCDFAHDKHQGRVTCVPLLAKSEYHTELQLPKLRERLASKPLAELRKILATSSGPNISDQRLRAWVTEEDPDSIVSHLGLDGSAAEIASQSLISIRLLDSPGADLREAVSTLVDAQLRGPNPPNETNARRQVLDPMKAVYGQPPGDALFLNAIAPGMCDGYFAYLRHLEQVLEPAISIGPSRRGSEYRRIARLHDRFIHAVVQRFAMVFMAIGLPREYEELRDFHSELLGEDLS